jgi:hypothetical protein
VPGPGAAALDHAVALGDNIVDRYT